MLLKDTLVGDMLISIYFTSSCEFCQNSGSFSNASAILSGSTSMYNFAVKSGDECRINRWTVVKGTPACANNVPKILRNE